MADYTVSTNLISWIPAMHGVFGWPTNGSEAEVIRGMKVGDLIVPKFAQNPVHGDQSEYQKAVAAVFDEDWEVRKEEYIDKVDWGSGAVPFVMRVGRQLGDQDQYPSAEPWAAVEVSLDWLDFPVSTSEYLRLRVVPVDLAGQFKAMAAPNKHIQPLPEGAAAGIVLVGKTEERDYSVLRREVLIRATDAAEAVAHLSAAGVEVQRLDRAFLVTPDAISGLHTCEQPGQLKSRGEPIATKPGDLAGLLRDAKAKWCGSQVL